MEGAVSTAFMMGSTIHQMQIILICVESTRFDSGQPDAHARHPSPPMVKAPTRWFRWPAPCCWWRISTRRGRCAASAAWRSGRRWPRAAQHRAAAAAGATDVAGDRALARPLSGRHQRPDVLGGSRDAFQGLNARLLARRDRLADLQPVRDGDRRADRAPLSGGGAQLQVGLVRHSTPGGM